MILLAYNKKDKDIEHLFNFRSIIIDADTKELLCFSPPKSVTITSDIHDDMFLQSKENLVIEEFIEGTMINVFWDRRSNCWEYATRNKIGADTHFYDNQRQTFRQMFEEALNHLDIDLNNCSKYCSYTFVLQHPENRLVTDFKEIKLYLIDIFEIFNTFDTENLQCICTTVKQYTRPLQTALYKSMDGLSSPKYSQNIFNGFDDVKKFLPTKNYTYMGLVIRNVNSLVHYKIRNPSFEHVRSLRGNQSKLMKRYFEVKRDKLLTQYLSFFPEHNETFFYYKHMHECLVVYIHFWYVLYFVKRQFPFQYDSKCYIVNTIRRLHKLYKHHKHHKKEKSFAITKRYIYLYLLSCPIDVLYKMHQEYEQAINEVDNP
jgi:hypothetical protein